jgi:uncharacterized protein (TIGR00297 family)
MKQAWQSKLVLLAVLPVVGVDLLFQIQAWASQHAAAAVWTVGLSALLGLVTWKLRAATAAAAAAGAAITANLMFSTAVFPYEPWHTALIPVLAVSVLAFAATRAGRGRKERLGTAERREGRSAAQVAANLGVAALVCTQLAQSPILQFPILESRWFRHAGMPPALLFAVGLAALAEAAADTVSSEMGQVLGGQPRMITTLRAVEPGRNGAMSLAGTLAGTAASGLVAGAGTWALRGGLTMFAVSCAGGVFGFLFDSLLGATLEERGWLNNDAVNLLSTAAAAAFALVALALLPHSALR